MLMLDQTPLNLYLHVWAKSPKRQGGLDRNKGALSPEIRGRIQPKYAPVKSVLVNWLP